MFVLLAALAIALGVTLSSSSSKTVTEIVAIDLTPSPSISISPSSSFAPSSTPTACVDKITTNVQKIDLSKDLQVDTPIKPKVALDETNMIVVAQDGKYHDANGPYNGPVLVAFYSMDENEDVWQMVQSPFRVNYNSDKMYQVALSGTTAFVMLSGIVNVYEQNLFGDWELVEDPFRHDANATVTFGDSIDIDEDLACIGEYNFNFRVFDMNLYHREDDNKWVHFDTIHAGEYGCSISGDVISIGYFSRRFNSRALQLYTYNQHLIKVTPLQDPIIITGWHGNIIMDLSNYHLVRWDRDERDAFVYSRDERANRTYTLHQQLNITGQFENSVALGGDVLIVGGDNQTHVFSLRNDEWVETIILDELYSDYQLFGRNLVASNEYALHFFDIQDCMQNMPTQAPTTLHPSLSPSSPKPSSSQSPTACAIKVSGNKQLINLQKDLQIDIPIGPYVAVDGVNMVGLIYDTKYDADTFTFLDGSVFISFYSMDKDDKWQRVQPPIRVENVNDYWLNTLALSGTTAFIGLPDSNNNAGMVHVYEQNQIGKWERVEDPFIHDDNHENYFGDSVDIAGDLACIDDNFQVHLYHRVSSSTPQSNKWVQFDTIDGSDCSVSGDIIAIRGGYMEAENLQLYKYSQDTSKVTAIQDIIPITGTMTSLHLSNNYLVYRDGHENEAVSIYSQDKASQTFTFDQRLDISGPFNRLVALDNDVLVVGGDSQTYIFSLQNDEWVETITLDETFTGYQLSGRKLVVSTKEDEIYSFRFQDCIQDVPTQAPATSILSTTASSAMTTLPCVDTPNYLDIYGGTCADYELPGNENWCLGYGNEGELGMTPKENCCFCKAKL